MSAPGPARTDGESPALDRERLAAARLWAAGAQPYLSTALFALTWRAVPGLGTFAVDRRWRLYADPAVLERWTVPETGAVLLHEVGHLVRDSAGRGDAVGVGAERSAARAWNAATDAAINADLDVAGVVLPGDGGVRPHHLGGEVGMTAEELYRLARDRPSLTLRVRLSDCGSGAHGRPREWEDAAPDGAPGVDPAEAVLIRAEVARAVRDAARRGDVPGGWDRWAQAQGPARVDWRRLLGRAVRGGVADAAGQVDYSYRRPSRRAASSPRVVLPALRRPLPTVAVVVDTSASVDEELLGQALAEVDGVLKAVGVHGQRSRVLSVDADVHRVQEVRRVGEVRLAGGGGTDLRVGLAAAAALRPRPDLVVVLTDGDTPWPDRPPRPGRVVVVLLDGPRVVPAWATRVVVDG